MEVLLCKGDLALDHCGNPIPLAGEQAVLQRAAIRLGVRRGSFPGDPNLGSRLHLLRGLHRQNALEQAALTAVRQALQPMPEIQVRQCTVRRDAAADRLWIWVLLGYSGRDWKLEVQL